MEAGRHPGLAAHGGHHRGVRLPDREDPDELLDGHAALLDAAYRGAAGRFDANEAVSLDDAGRVHVARIKAESEPASLLDLRGRVEAMMPRVDLPEVILEVMSWEPGFGEAFTPVSGGRSRLRMKDLDITIAACLTSHALTSSTGRWSRRASRPWTTRIPRPGRHRPAARGAGHR